MEPVKREKNMNLRYIKFLNFFRDIYILLMVFVSFFLIYLTASEAIKVLSADDEIIRQYPFGWEGSYRYSSPSIYVLSEGLLSVVIFSFTGIGIFLYFKNNKNVSAALISFGFLIFSFVSLYV